MAFSALRHPATRVLLPRTRLAYVHLGNLLSDAKRDRSARVSGYVMVWLPDEILTLYLHSGEVVNATVRDAAGSRPIAIARALEQVPPQPEYGEICFHELDEEILACMFQTQTVASIGWPNGLAVTDPAVLFPFLMATTFDGTVEIMVGDAVNYLVFRDGAVARAVLATPRAGTAESVVERVKQLFVRDGRAEEIRVERWGPAEDLPPQAPPALVQSYRELAAELVRRIEVERPDGRSIAEHTRQKLAVTHPVLDGFTFSARPVREPVTDTDGLTAGVAAWVREFVWATVDHDALTPEALLRELTWDRRHMFQAAGLYDQLPWKVL
ncbi:MAG TPA: hypothetical protein VMH39_14550 [Gemmatimonadaceae bacterium]|nr:hypothetical protein [Gemmatimonadaceae bacterium]